MPFRICITLWVYFCILNANDQKPLKNVISDIICHTIKRLKCQFLNKPLSVFSKTDSTNQSWCVADISVDKSIVKDLLGPFYHMSMVASGITKIELCI